MRQYSPQIIEHFTNPRHVGELSDADVIAVVRNAACGDQLRLFAHLDGERIVRCQFLAFGCAASLATGSILAETAHGLTMSQLADIDEERVVELLGGVTPSQRHCAVIGRQALQTLVTNFHVARGQTIARPVTEPVTATCPITIGSRT
jgi:NifU-like protein involved in Fe-S cluster formation